MAKLRGIADIRSTTLSGGDNLLRVNGSLNTVLSTKFQTIIFNRDGVGDIAYFSEDTLTFTHPTLKSYYIRTNSTDDSDDREIILSSAQSPAPTRGAYIRVIGNEFTSNPGDIRLIAGNIAGGGNIISRTASGNITLETLGANNIRLRTNNLDRWTINSSGHLSATGALNITSTGTSTLGPILSNSITNNGSSDQIIGTTTSHVLSLKTNNIERWQIGTAGHLFVGAHNTYDIGTSSTRVRKIYADEVNANSLTGSASVFPRPNNTWITWRNAADSDDINLIKADTNDDVVLNSTTSKLIKFTNTAGSAFTTEFDYVNQVLRTSATSGISRLRNISGTLIAVWASDITNSRTVVGTETSHDLHFLTNNLLRWHIDTTGRLAQNSTNGADILFQRSGFGVVWDGINGRIGTSTANTLALRTNNLNRLIISSDGLEYTFQQNSVLNRSVNTGYLSLGGGTGNDSDTGAHIRLYGISDGTFPGQLILSAAATGAQSHVLIRTRNTTGHIIFETNDLERWLINASNGNLQQNASNGGDLVLNKNDTQIRQGTSDGSDINRLFICGGGSNTPDRGSFIRLSGNESSSVGNLDLFAGESSSIRFFTGTSGSTQRWFINSVGHFIPADHNSYDIGTSSSRVRKLHVVDLDVSGVTTGTGLNWNVITGTSASMSAENGYIANNASLVTLTLPSTCIVGKIIRVVGLGAGGWRIAQNSGQIIHVGDTATTTGTGGEINSTHRRDTIELICVVANTEFCVLSSTGTLDVV